MLVDVGVDSVFLFIQTYYAAFRYEWQSPTSPSWIALHWHVLLALLQQSTRRQGALAFALFGVLLAHGDLRNNKLSQLAVNLWNLSHKHGYCETRISVSSHTHTPITHLTDFTIQCLLFSVQITVAFISKTAANLLHVSAALLTSCPLSLLQVRTLECIKHQAQQPDMTHLSDTVQRLALQSRTWTPTPIFVKCLCTRFM